MSDQENFLQWKIRNGMFGWDHEYAELIDAAHDLGVGSGLSELASLRQQLEAERARVAAQTDALQSIAVAMKDAGALSKEMHDLIVTATEGSSEAFLLRSQADAVKLMAEKVREGQERASHVVTAVSIYEGLLGYEAKYRDKADEADGFAKEIEEAQRLRQKADRVDGD